MDRRVGRSSFRPLPPPNLCFATFNSETVSSWDPAMGLAVRWWDRPVRWLGGGIGPSNGRVVGPTCQRVGPACQVARGILLVNMHMQRTFELRHIMEVSTYKRCIL
jgi:hypothetical protein